MRRFVSLLAVVVLLAMPVSAAGLEMPRSVNALQQSQVAGIVEAQVVLDAQVTVGGRTFPALAARVGDRLFVAGGDLYGHLLGSTLIYDSAGGFGIAIDNGLWSFVVRMVFCAGASTSCEVTGSEGRRGNFPLATPSILVRNRVLLPVGETALPYLMVQVDGAQIHVAPAADWPASELPRSIAEAVAISYPSWHIILHPGPDRGEIHEIFIRFGNAKGALIRPVRRLQATFSVPPDSPLRLVPDNPANKTPLVTSLTVSGDWPRVAVFVPMQTKYVREDTFHLTATLPDHSPVRWEIQVQDLRPYAFAAAISTPVRAGQAATVTVRLLDRHGVTADWWVSPPVDGSPVPVRVEIRGPAGAVDAKPEFKSPHPTVWMLFQHGVAVYHFTPPVPGPYTLMVTGSVYVAPWPLTAAIVRFTVAR